MPIPLSQQRAMLQTPTAQAGKTIDPSDAISNIGQMAANSMKLAAKATDDMGAAIQLLQRQDEDIKAKEAYLKYEEALTAAQTELETKQGLAAEKWRNNQYRKAVEKAQSEFDNVMHSLNYADIRNASVESNIKMGVNADAQADNYAFKEKLAARNQMSKDLQESYTRQAKAMIMDINSPDEKVRKMAIDNRNAMLNNLRAEVINNANLNGLLDKDYQKLKLQEAVDEFQTEMADELSHPRDGFKSAEDYLKANKGSMSTAAWEKAYQALDEKKLIYDIAKNPNKYIKNGKYDEELAYQVAPHLDDQARYRILSGASSAAKGGASAADIELATPIARQYDLTLRRTGAELGFDLSKERKIVPTATGKQKEYNEEMQKRYKNSKLSEIQQWLFNNGEVPASQKMVIKDANGNEVVIQNMTALSADDFTDVEESVFRAIDGTERGTDRKHASDGLQRGWVTRAQYNTFDGIGGFLEEQGLPPSQIIQVFNYMNRNRNATVDVKDKDGKVIGQRRLYPHIMANYNFYEEGAYDDLWKNGKIQEQQDIQNLLNAAIMDVAGSKDVSNIAYQKPGRVVRGSLIDFLNRQKALEQAAVTRNEFVGDDFSSRLRWALREGSSPF